MKRKITKKIIKVTLLVLGIFLALDLLIVGLLFVPPIQEKVVGIVTEKLSEKWGSKVSVDHIYLSPTMKLYAEGFAIYDCHDNPMISAEMLSSRLRTLKLKPIHLGFGEIDSKGVRVVVRKYKGDDAVNISLWAKNFQKKKKSPQPFRMSSPSIVLKDAYFLYRNDDVCTTKDQGQIDFGYFELKDLDARLDHFNLLGSNIDADIEHITFNQYTGFQLKKLAGKFHIGPTGLSIQNASVATASSRIFMDFAFEYGSWHEYSDFLNKIKLNVNAKSSTIDLHDIGYFAPQTAGMDNQLVFSGKVTGPINDLNITDMDARYADNTHLSGTLALGKVTDFFNADIHAKFSQSNVDLQELQAFKLPGGKSITLPSNIANLGVVDLDVEYDGVISDKLDVAAVLLTDIGDIDATLHSDRRGDGPGIDYNLQATARGLSVNRALPKVNMIGGLTGSVQAHGTVGDLQQFANTLTADVKADIDQINIKGYPLRRIHATGNYGNRQIDAVASIHDPNCTVDLSGSMDLSKKKKEYEAEGSIAALNLSKLFQHLPKIDSSKAKGFEALVYYAQKHPEVALSIGHLSCDLNASSLKDLSGNVFIDSIAYSQDGKTMAMDRMRLISLASEGSQLIKLSSDMLNLSLNTNYDLKDVPAAILDLAYTYCGNLLPQRKAAEAVARTDDPALDLSITAHHLSPILDMFVPNVQIADNTKVNIRTNASHSDDYIDIFSPDIRVGDGVRISSVQVSTVQSDTATLRLNAAVQSLAIGNEGNLVFSNISMGADAGPQAIDCRLSWDNPPVISNRPSLIAASINFDNGGVIRAKVNEAKVHFKELLFTFNPDHLVTIDHGTVNIDNLILNSQESEVYVNGFVGKAGDSLVANIDGLDIDFVNLILKTDKLHLGGELSANVQLRDVRGTNMLFGTAIIEDFEFNQEQFGHLYANAILPSDKNIRFRGGFINPEYFPEDATVFNYTYSKDFVNQQGVNTRLNGIFETDQKKLKVTADIDTLPLGFLEPMLSSFSHKFDGNASGDIDFVLTADTMYFEGKAHVREAEIGIAPLNTFYYLKNQDIDFTKEGFAFNNIVLTDKFDNRATMDGYVNHKNFNDFNLNLKISTPKIFVLNTKQGPDAPFYGDGFVSGDISISGNTDRLAFYGDNLRTQKGTVFCLPISFSDKVSNSDVITFVAPPPTTKTKMTEMPEPVAASSTEMDFDFTFDVTDAADIKLDLDLSAFGGKIDTKGEGRLHFTYNTKKDKIEMLGDVVLQSGKFVMTFAQLLNKKFELMPGGVVNFPGPITDININVKAAYSTTASLSDLFSAESTNLRSMPVKAYLNFNGNLNDPAAIDFSFDLPNATSDFKTLFYSTIDTSDIQKKTEQFFSLVMLGKFASQQTSVADFNIENTGIGVLTSTLSNFISNQLKFVDVNLNYKNADADQAAEYTVGASTSLFNNRTIIETYVGYKDDKSASLSNQFIGDFSVEQLLNEIGTWRLKVFNVTTQDELRNASRTNPYAQGVAVIYKQDFDNRKDLRESFIRQKREKRARKNKDKEQNQ